MSLFARSKFTLFIVLRGQLARAEFERGVPPKLVRFERGPLPAHGSLAELFESATLPGGEPQGPLWIVTDEVFTRTLELDAALVAGLDDAALGSALAYEAQLLSGLAASDAVVAWRATGATRDPRTYWVTQLARTEFEQLASDLAARGGELRGIVHAAGLPHRFTAPAAGETGAWRRVESWPELGVEIEGSESGTLAVRVRPTGGARTRRETAAGANVVESLAAGGLAAAPAPRELDLDKDEAALAEWATAWAHVLATGDVPVPALVPAERPVALRTLASAALALALVALAGCWLHQRAQQDTLRELRAAALSTSQPAERVSTAQRERANIETQIAALERALALADAGRTNCAWSADAAARWMELLAELRPAGLRVEELDLGWRGSVVRGLAVDAATIDVLASSVTNALGADGCSATATSKRWRALPDGGGVYEFELGLGGPERVAAPAQESDG